jgi:hypothetical protein
MSVALIVSVNACRSFKHRGSTENDLAAEERPATARCALIWFNHFVRSFLLRFVFDRFLFHLIGSIFPHWLLVLIGHDGSCYATRIMSLGQGDRGIFGTMLPVVWTAALSIFVGTSL